MSKTKKNTPVVKETKVVETEVVDLTASSAKVLETLPSEPTKPTPSSNGKRVYRAISKLSKTGVGQAGLIQSFFNENESGTCRQITDYCVSKGLQTRQDPLKVVMFYMITYKKQGKVELV